METLDSGGVKRHGYHKDLVVEGVGPQLAVRLLDACQSAWVFGGMVSWNDNRATPTCIATLLTPSSGATVIAPPTFTWSFSGTCSAKVYVATNPIPEQIAVFSNVFSAGLNAFTPSASRWSSAVAYLGSAPVYYWTIGNADTSLQDTYAAWRPFTTMPIFTGGGGGGLQPPSNGQFRFEITAPNQMQITVQASDDLVNWSDIGTSNIVNGKTMFTDPNAALTQSASTGRSRKLTLAARASGVSPIRPARRPRFCLDT